MQWTQKIIQLKKRCRGFHLITDEVMAALPELAQIDTGLLHLFIQHTSASLTINENADPTVRSDLETHFRKAVPDGARYYQHDYEGDDDMPAHIKASIMGASLSIPVAQGRLLLGTWQGIYLGEHREHGSSRKLVATLMGSTRQ